MTIEVLKSRSLLQQAAFTKDGPRPDPVLERQATVGEERVDKFAKGIAEIDMQHKGSRAHTQIRMKLINDTHAANDEHADNILHGPKGSGLGLEGKRRVAESKLPKFHALTPEERQDPERASSLSHTLHEIRSDLDQSGAGGVNAALTDAATTANRLVIAAYDVLPAAERQRRGVTVEMNAVKEQFLRKTQPEAFQKYDSLVQLIQTVKYNHATVEQHIAKIAGTPRIQVPSGAA